MHVVFGAGGALGALVVRNLAQQNKPVRAVVRDVDRARKVLPSSVEIVVADASKPNSIKPAFQNASFIYHCVNVPYDKWTEVMPLVTDTFLEVQSKAKRMLSFPAMIMFTGHFRRSQRQKTIL